MWQALRRAQETHCKVSCLFCCCSQDATVTFWKTKCKLEWGRGAVMVSVCELALRGKLTWV